MVLACVLVLKNVSVRYMTWGNASLFILVPSLVHGTWGNTKYTVAFCLYQHQIYTYHIPPPKKESAFDLIPSTRLVLKSWKKYLYSTWQVWKENHPGPGGVRTSLVVKRVNIYNHVPLPFHKLFQCLLDLANVSMFMSVRNMYMIQGFFFSNFYGFQSLWIFFKILEILFKFYTKKTKIAHWFLLPWCKNELLKCLCMLSM
jgi:hypothetical protein